MSRQDAAHAQAMERVGEGILAAAKQQELQLDYQLKQMENLDEDDFEALREKRRLQMQKQLRQEQDWRQLGHGVYSELTDTKEFFNAAKKSSRMIVHFYRSVTPRCEIVDAHFQKLAPTHVETRFVKIDAEKNPYLVEKLGIILMPTIVLIKDGKTDHAIHGFDEFGGTDDFTTEDCAYVLSTHGVLNYDGGDRSEDVSNRSTKAGFNAIKVNRITSSRYVEDSDSD